MRSLGGFDILHYSGQQFVMLQVVVSPPVLPGPSVAQSKSTLRRLERGSAVLAVEVVQNLEVLDSLSLKCPQHRTPHSRLLRRLDHLFVIKK